MAYFIWSFFLGFKEGSCQFLKHWSVLQLALYGGVGRPSALPKLSSVFQLQRHKTLHFGGNFMKIGPKLKKLSVFKGQFYMYSIFEVFIVEWDYIL